MSATLKTHPFLAMVYKIWMMRHIDVPEDVSSALIEEMQKAQKSRARSETAKAKYIPVAAIVNRCSARTTLVPAGGGRFRMQINTALRKAARVDAGDLVSVELRLDRASRSLPVPPDLRAGLKSVPKAKKAFDALAPGHRRHFIQWFDSAKSPEARQRRLERAFDVLLERALLQPRRPAKRRSVKHRRGESAA
jgi:hypothetical protein